MSNYLPQPGVRRRPLLGLFLAAVAANLVGCGSNSEPSGPLPEDPYEALKELNRRLDSQLTLGRYTVAVNDSMSLTRFSTANGGRIEITRRSGDHNRLSTSLTTPDANWFAMTFSTDTTREGGKYIEGSHSVLMSTAGSVQRGTRALLTNNPNQTTFLVWKAGESDPVDDNALFKQAFSQMARQADLLIGSKLQAEQPVLADIQYKT